MHDFSGCKKNFIKKKRNEKCKQSTQKKSIKYFESYKQMSNILSLK